MGFWKRLFGGRGEGQDRHASGSAHDLDAASRKETAAKTIRYTGGDPVSFYAAMSRHLLKNHGALVRVDFLKGFPDWQFLLVYKDGTRIYSLKHVSGDFDLHRLTLGYSGEGTRLMRTFLANAGMNLPSNAIEELTPGQSIVIESGVTVVKSAKPESTVTHSVVFVSEGQEEVAGMPATVIRYKADSEAEAIAFLEEQDVSGQSVFLLVETPEGTFGKDRTGMLE